MTDRAPGQGLPTPDVQKGLTRVNAPGLPEIVYRGGAYAGTLERMLSRLPRQATGVDTAAPLHRINVDVDDDWTIALLRAWAAITEVLGFYQERLINEGYLRTARLPLSVVQLARGTGYAPRPGLAATTYLALSVQPAQGETFVPAGTQVQSVPPPASGAGIAATALPQVFETAAALVARAEWNEIRLASAQRGTVADWATQDRALGPGTTRLRLPGQRLDLQKGDLVLIVEERAAGSEERGWRLVRLVGIEPDPARSVTWIEWEDDPRVTPDGRVLVNPRLFLLRPAVPVLANTPTGLYYAPAGEPWMPAGAGLPAAPVHALLRTRAGRLLAGTDKDVFASTDGGRTWQPAPTGVLARAVTAMAVGEAGALFAGTDDGRVFETRDEGATWRPTTPDTTLAPVRGVRKRWPAAFGAPLPKTTIRALHAFRSGQRALLAAGTDDGVFLSADGGDTWKPANLYAPDVEKSGRSKQTAWSLTAARLRGSRRRPRLLAGTNAGVVPPRAAPALWPIVLLSLILVAVQRLLLPAATPLVGLPLAAANALQSAGYREALIQWAGSVPALEGGLMALSGALDGLVAQLADLKLPESWEAIGASSLDPGWLDNAVQQIKNARLFLFALDAALVAALLVAIVAVSILAWRYLYNRPSRRIRGNPVPSAGLLANLLRTVPGGKTLAARLRTWPAVPVYALATNGRGELVAATEQGIYVNAAPPPSERGPRLSFLHRGGIEERGQWRRVNGAVAARAVALSRDERTLLAAGQPVADPNAPAAVWRSDDDGETWEKVPGDLGLVDVQVLLDAGAGWFAGGTPHEGETEPHWSAFHLEEAAIHLGAVNPAVEPGAWLVMTEPSPPSGDGRGEAPRLYRVRASGQAPARDAVRTDTVTWVRVDSAEDGGAARGLAGFDRTRCTVLLQKQQLAVYDDAPVWGHRIRLDRFVAGLAPGQRLFVRGKRMRVRLAAADAPPLRLESAGGLVSVPVQAGVSYILAAAPPPPAPPPSGGDNGREPRLYLEDREGLVGYVDPGTAHFLLEPPDEKDDVVSELATIRLVEHEAGTTLLTLEAPLANVYERATVTIHANVVAASHGKTVRGEVLGSSDASAAGHRFRLRQGPLTYLSQPSEDGLASQLQVSVAGVTWHEASFLYGRAHHERVYVAQQDEKGHTMLTFGDGQTGARLPSTREEVTATYRIGGGAVGNVAGDSLTQIMSGAPGIDRITNPLPAAGGVDPEPASTIKENTAVSLRAMHRIVSLSDYADFCRTFAGIGQAQATHLHTGRDTLLHITVADADGNPLSTGSELYTNLVAAIEQRRATPVPRVQVDSYEPRYFDVELTLIFAPDHRQRQAAIEAAARAALLRAFGLSGRTFARDVSAAEIIRLLQPLAGLVAVEIIQLALHGGDGAAAALPAFPARWDPAAQIARPAQLLLVNPHDGGILIRLEPAP